MIRTEISYAAEDILLITADHNWRKGPRWKAALAWMFGRRDRFTTHLGDHAVIAWLFGEAYLVRLTGGTDA